MFPKLVRSRDYWGDRGRGVGAWSKSNKESKWSNWRSSGVIGGASGVTGGASGVIGEASEAVRGVSGEVRNVNGKIR